MPKQYSTNFKRTVSSVAAPEFPLVLIEIDREDLATPIRLVNDRSDIVHNANTFTAVPFRINLPDDPETGFPQATLSIDNVGKILTSYVESTDWNKPTTCKIIQVLRSTPNVAEFSMSLSMTDVAMTSTEVTAKLGFEDLFAVPAINFKYTPFTSPGLF